MVVSGSSHRCFRSLPRLFLRAKGKAIHSRTSLRIYFSVSVYIVKSSNGRLTRLSIGQLERGQTSSQDYDAHPGIWVNGYLCNF
jgi:hypothetical protein